MSKHLHTPEFKYIEGTVIANNVMNTLKSYFEQGIVDESHIYKPMRSCLDRIGFKVYPTRYAHIPIVDKKGVLPCNFHRVISAIGVGSYEVIETDPSQPLKLVENYNVQIPVCKTAANMCSDSCGNVYELLQEFDLYKVKYERLFDLKVNQTNIGFEYGNTTNEITIQNNTIYANFSGSVYMEYLATLELEDGDILIPDYSQITDWIETEIIVECLRSVYLNNERDVLQRLQYMEMKAKEKEAVARTFWKMGEVQDFYDVRKALKNRFAKHEYLVNGTVSQNIPYIKY